MKRQRRANEVSTHTGHKPETRRAPLVSIAKDAFKLSDGFNSLLKLTVLQCKCEAAVAWDSSPGTAVQANTCMAEKHVPHI